MFTRTTIKYDNTPRSIVWRGNDLIDWVDGGSIYSLNGKFTYSSKGYGFSCDAVISINNSEFAIIYKKLGTKGLILKNGEIIREINRASYQSEAYEFPICFLKLKNEKLAIAHCPNEYNVIEIEELESGIKLTSYSERPEVDCFHSRFKVNQDNSYLLNTGWVWHPLGIIEIYNIEEALKDNSILDKGSIKFPLNCEVSSAEFLTNDLIVISSTNDEPWSMDEMHEEELNPNQIGLYSIKDSKFIKKIQLKTAAGTIIPISEDYVISLFEYPKIIDLNSGEIVEELEGVKSGTQDSAITGERDNVPPIAIDLENKRIAIVGTNKVELLKW